METPQETGQGERETQGEVTGQGRPSSPKMVQSAEGGKAKDKGKESMWLLEAPVRKMILQMHTPACTSQWWSRQTQLGLGVEQRNGSDKKQHTTNIPCISNDHRLSHFLTYI